MTIETHDGSYDAVALQAMQNRITALEGCVLAPQEVIVARNQVLELVDRLEEKIDNWVALIETTSNEYYQDKYNDSIILIEPVVLVLTVFIIILFRGIQLTLKQSSKSKW